MLSSRSIPAVKATAEKYLAAIKQQEDEKLLEQQRAYSIYVVGNLELGRGMTAISPSHPVTAESQHRAAVGGFAQLNGDVEVRKPLSGAGSYGFVALDSSNRDYARHNFMNSSTNTVRGGLNWRSGMDTYRIRVSHQEYRQQGTAVSQGITADSTQNALFGSARIAMGQYDTWACHCNTIRPGMLRGPDRTPIRSCWTQIIRTPS